jgi:hypothetical protein
MGLWLRSPSLSASIRASFEATASQARSSTVPAAKRDFLNGACAPYAVDTAEGLPQIGRAESRRNQREPGNSSSWIVKGDTDASRPNVANDNTGAVCLKIINHTLALLIVLSS